jgi:hypothetical protein
MSKVYTVQFPLQISKEVDTFKVLDQNAIEEVVKFNLKSTILTCPNERRSDPNFGACAKGALFDFSETSINSLRTRISKQIQQYVPYCFVEDLLVTVPNDSPDSIYIRIKYRIAEINKKDVFELTLSA